MKKIVLNTYFGLLLISLLTPFWTFSKLQFPYITSKAFFFRIAMELLLPLYVYLVLADKNFRPKLKNPLNLSVLLFLLANVISSFFGVNVIRSLWGNFERMGGTYYLAHLVALYFYLQLLGQAGENYLKRFLQSFVVVAFLITLNGLSGWLGGPTLVRDPSLPARVSSTFGNPIFFASFLIIPMFLAAYFAVFTEEKKWKVVYWIAAFVQLLGIYSSGTRGAVVGLLFGLFVAAVFYVLLNKNRKVRKGGLIAILVFAMLIFAMYFFHNKFTPGSTLYRIANLKDSNTEARLIQWKIALSGFKDRPMFGAGPENYYVIFDQYYNPELYKYDSSWFDKPHNFLIEVLVTNGLFGFAAYLAIFILGLYALWRAYKAGLLGLAETSLLLAAIITYQVQNLFVFDTVSPSIAFYCFMGLSAFMWVESKKRESKLETNAKASELLKGILVMVILITFVIIYYSNIQSIQAAKRTNFGYAYTYYNPQIAANYFEAALSIPLNLDPRETANRYSDFAAALVNSEAANKNPEFVLEQLNKSIKAQRAITEKTGNDPLLWLRLAIGEMNYAQWNHTSLNPAWEAINKAIAIAPKRVEILQTKMQLYSINKDWSNVSEMGQKIVELNPYNPSFRWQLAMAYYLDNKVEEAVKAGDEAVAQGYKFSQLQQFAWYIQYYEEKKDYAKVAPLLEKAIELQPNEIGLYVDLAKVYANLGDKDHAMALAEQVIKSDPTQKNAMEAFIESLK